MAIGEQGETTLMGIVRWAGLVHVIVVLFERHFKKSILGVFVHVSSFSVGVRAVDGKAFMEYTPSITLKE